MSLTVEDGTGLAAADAFVSVEDCTAYCAAHGLTDWTSKARSPADDDEAAIRRATTWLSTAFTYKGQRTHGRDQALAFPRTDCTDGGGEAIASDEAPFEIVHACAVAAAYERANPGGLTPTVTFQNRIRSKQVGPLRKEFFDAPVTIDAAKPTLTAVHDLIKGLLADGASNTGTLLRG